MLYIHRYKDTAKILSQRAKDQPITSVDTAAWWVEYVLRHDTTHLKSPSMKDRWWQKRMLDVWFLVYTILLFITFVIYKSFKFLLCLMVERLTNRNRSKEKKLK